MSRCTASLATSPTPRRSTRADYAQQILGGVDILVNNTGGPPFGAISQVEPETWQAQFEAMVLSVFRLTGHLLPGMREGQ